MKTLTPILSALAIALTLALLAPAAEATTLVPVSLEEMTAQADLIVHGRVLSQKSVMGPERRYIYTTTEVEVASTFKGKAPARVTIRQLGGAVGDLSMEVPGNAEMAVGEEIVVFLDSDEARPLHYVIGMMQGKWTVDHSGAEPVMRRNLTGATLLGKAHQSAPELKPPTFYEFKAQVRRLLAR